MVRELCEAYMGLTPLVIQDMHLDQIVLLICDKDRIKGQARVIKCTPQEAVARGFIQSMPESSYLAAFRQRISEKRKREAEQRAERKQQSRHERRQRRQRGQQNAKG